MKLAFVSHPQPFESPKHPATTAARYRKLLTSKGASRHAFLGQMVLNVGTFHPRSVPFRWTIPAAREGSLDPSKRKSKNTNDPRGKNGWLFVSRLSLES
jgi:hypothetical protein